MPIHVSWPGLLAPFAALAAWITVHVHAPRLVIGAGSVAAGWIAGRMSAGVLAALARAILLIAGIVVAYYVVRA